MCRHSNTHRHFGKYSWQNMKSQKLTLLFLCTGLHCIKILSWEVASLLFQRHSLHFFLITWGISTCKTPRFASLHILTSWLLYFQTVLLLFPTIFSSFLLLESSLLLIICLLRVNGSYSPPVLLTRWYKGFRGGNSWQSTRRPQKQDMPCSSTNTNCGWK